jgi:threonine/homoserine/homoserine lactone efflux protein
MPYNSSMLWLAFLLRGLPLGLTAAVMPGPYQLFIFAEAAKKGWRKTILLSIVPLLSDGPIIIALFFLLRQTPNWFLTLLKILGGLFILYLAYGAYKSSSKRLELNQLPTQSYGLLKGIAMNFLNPNPWIFWSVVGIPILLEGLEHSTSVGLSFILGFYLAMIPTLMAMIIIFAVAKRFGPKLNQTLQKIAALLLAAFGLYQLYQGLVSIF